MKERPILLSGPMVRAILDGRKTQTRRVVKPWPPAEVSSVYRPFAHEPNNWQGYAEHDGLIHWYGRCPYGQPGDRLWCRETWGEGWTYAGERPAVFYRATMDGLAHEDRCLIRDKMLGASAPSNGMKWRPSIFMPRWASRLTLEITGVRVERLQAISEADCYAEGIECTKFAAEGEHLQPATGVKPGRYAYRALWESINGPGSWDANPWVWVVEFRRVDAALKEGK